MQKKLQLTKGYNVLARVRGKFVKISKSPVSKGEALQLGSKYVQGSAAATFKLEKTGKLVRKKKGLYVLSPMFRTKTTSKGETLFIEKTKYRINTPGELSQITLKGQQTIKTRRPQTIKKTRRLRL